jgi:hypothetical protein
LQNYFNYFTEIEDQFQRRRGSILLLSTVDWALIETWREAGIPLAAVLRGIDAAFDKHDAKQSKRSQRKVNGLAWCAQAVMMAAEEMREVSVGMAQQPATGEPAASERESAGFEQERVALHLLGCAEALRRAADTVMDEKLFAAVLAAEPEEDVVKLKEQSARELAPYRSRMQALQIRQIEQQFLHKKLIDKYRLPRLSLFYMGQG